MTGEIGDSDDADSVWLRKLQTLAVLPSESSIHVIVYAALAQLAFLYGLLAPSFALFFDEGRLTAGAVFVVFHAALFAAVVVLQYRRHTAPPRGYDELRSFATLIRNVPFRRLFARFGVSRRAPVFVPYPDASRATCFARLVDETWRHVMGDRTPPSLFWTNTDRRAAARVMGTSRDPVLGVSAGLVSLCRGKPEVVRVYLLHEFGHVRLGDLEVFALTLALLRGCEAALASSVFASALWVIPFLDESIWTGLLLMVAVVWLISVLAAWLFLKRYVGVIISLRELYADVQALLWLETFRVYGAIVQTQDRLRWIRWAQLFRSLATFRLVHLSANERLRMLRRPEQLVGPRHRYYAISATLCVALLNNPFGEGFGRNWMRLPFLLLWAPLCTAYLWNVVRALMGLGILTRGQALALRSRMTFGVSIMLLLPHARLPGLFANVVLSFGGDWIGFGAGVRDMLRTVAAQWHYPSLLLIPVLSALWLWLSGSRSVFGLRPGGQSGPFDSAHIRPRPRRALAVCVVAVIMEVGLLAIVQFESFTPLPLDTISLWLLDHPATPGVLALVVLIGGSVRYQPIAQLFPQVP